MRHYEYESSLFVKTFVNWGGVRYHRQYNLLTYINTVFRLIACFFSVYFQQVNKTSPVGSNWYGWISKSPTWSEILLSSLSMIFIGCLLSHFDRSWSFIMEAILWRMWRHEITWRLSLHFWWKMTFNPSLKIRRFTINIYAWNQLKYTEDVYG